MGDTKNLRVLEIETKLETVIEGRNADVLRSREDGGKKWMLLSNIRYVVQRGKWRKAGGQTIRLGGRAKST